MPTPTASATARNEGNMERTRGGRKDSADSAEVRYTVREMFDKIQKDIADLTKTIAEKDDLTDRRLALVEQAVQHHELIVPKLEQLTKDFSGFERRFHDHENSQWHTQGQAIVVSLQSDVQHLKEQQLTSKAVADFVNQQKQFRQWLVGLSITAMLSIAGLLATLWKLFQIQP